MLKRTALNIHVLFIFYFIYLFATQKYFQTPYKCLRFKPLWSFYLTSSTIEQSWTWDTWKRNKRITSGLHLIWTLPPASPGSTYGTHPMWGPAGAHLSQHKHHLSYTVLFKGQQSSEAEEIQLSWWINQYLWLCNLKTFFQQYLDLSRDRDFPKSQ